MIGTQYGDEGKGKIIDTINAEYKIIARFNGGPNAGHTLFHEGKPIPLHQIPSGIFYPDKLLYIGSGCVLNLEKLLQEIKDVETLNISLEGRLVISDQVSIIQPHHLFSDGKHGGDLGTTGNGIGPAYEDKAQRYRNLRLADLLDDPIRSKDNMIKHYNQIEPEIDVRVIVERILDFSQQLKQYICRNPTWMVKQVESEKNVLFEGAQAVMLDVTHGTVPYVTSSHTIAGSAYVGGDLPPKYHRKTMGVAKAIMSRVGHGPFVSEFGGNESERYCMTNGGKKYTTAYEQSHYSPSDLMRSLNFFDLGIALRMRGEEYGATTKRPRRVGAIDLVQLAYACKSNGIDELYITKVDCLQEFSRTRLEGIPYVAAYESLSNVIIPHDDHFPTQSNDYKHITPRFQYAAAFNENISSIRKYDQLPQEVKNFVSLVEQYVGCSVKGIGVGPSREQIIVW